MTATIAIWVISSVAVFVSIVFARNFILHRRLRIADLNWKAAAVIAMLIASVVTFFFELIPHPPVDVPTEIDVPR